MPLFTLSAQGIAAVKKVGVPFETRIADRIYRLKPGECFELPEELEDIPEARGLLVEQVSAEQSVTRKLVLVRSEKARPPIRVPVPGISNGPVRANEPAVGEPVSADMQRQIVEATKAMRLESKSRQPPESAPTEE